MQPKLFKHCCFLFVTILFAAGIFAQENLPQDYLTPTFHQGRREAARELMPPNSVMVIFAAPTRTFSNDVEYLFHQNPDLFYFTGYKEPHAVLLLFKEPQTTAAGNNFTEVFFVQKRNERAESWTGRRLGTEGVSTKLGIATAFNGEDFKTSAIDFAKFDKIIFDEIPKDVVRGDAASLYQLLETFKEKSKMEESKNATEPKRFSTELFQNITRTLREVKTPEELVLLRKAVEISCLGQNEVMKSVRPDMSELEIQGLHEYIHKRYGAEHVGYGSIIGAGENGCILHYMENTKTKIGNDLILMDVGAEYHGYTADVTRTVPVDGKFSADERAIYQLVYDAQEAAFKTLKEGSLWADASKAAKDVIANGLARLGIIKNAGEVGRYYTHGLGHHIGLNVHDKSHYGPLKKDMVITIEPGIYIPANSSCNKKWWGLSVRIEDDALITQDGYELLSAFAPRSIDEIEKMIAEKSVLDNYKLPELKSGVKKAF